MKVGIMQPYFMPYIGYWQLINAVDKYVIHDDVNFIKGGWINRNRILLEDKVKYFNVQLIKASSNKKINEIDINTDFRVSNKTLRILELTYKKAPFYDIVQPVIKQILKCNKDNLSEYLINSIEIVCDYLGITTELVISSNLDKNCDLKGQERVIDICKLLGATEYYNAIGGQQLYSHEEFEKRGIKLKFLQTKKIEYCQFGNTFQENLSILDVMMFNSKDKLREFLSEYRLID